MRGEHLTDFISGIPAAGSSPHARGARWSCIRRPCCPRIIPACAGSTSAPTPPAQPTRDHPRMRGEHACVAYMTRSLPGSSPHARGAPVLPDAVRARPGIIPACAGSTELPLLIALGHWDHPRMRGEHGVSWKKSSTGLGSSPHARGARGPQGLAVLAYGIIPACAGSTTATARSSATSTDHPRMRGEHTDSEPMGRECTGSSPHARGALVAQPVAGGGDGIIPACAGSTPESWTITACCRDHPRMRGEHVSMRSMNFCCGGSSPHARGAPGGLLGVARGGGIIPACAGSTYGQARPSTTYEDHPRMRGEHPQIEAGPEFTGGSSPHARGALDRVHGLPAAGGIIPACAGSTAGRAVRKRAVRDHPRMRGEHWFMN